MTELMENESLFHKYPSIENSYREEFVEKVKMQGYGKVPYCITEKIHGSNTQICYDYKSKTFEYGKRTTTIAADESCYNVQKCFGLIKENVVDLADYLSAPIPGLKTVIVYGEVFGGSYPHQDVAKDNHASKVQKGVYYSNHNEWKAFDIAYTVEDDNRIHFLCGEDFFLACNAVGIDTVPLLKVTEDLDSALAYQNDASSVVYEHYNLPQLEDNIMEGVVIRPWKGDLWCGQSRVIFKNKNDKFKEKSHVKKVNIQVDIPEAVKSAQEEITAYITENRVNNVISHLGEVTLKDIGKIIGLTAKDVLEDFKKESGALNLLEKSEEKMVTKFMQNQVAKLVKEIMLR